MSMFDLSEMRVALPGWFGLQSANSTFDLAELWNALPHSSQSPMAAGVSNTRILQKTSFGIVCQTRNVITIRKPQVVLEDLLSNAIVGGHYFTDKRFITNLLDLASKHYQDAPRIQRNLCFENFRQLPMEIRKQIWLLSIPARTLHATDHTRERIAWNRGLPMPAPTISCREAWAILRPLIHDIYDNGRVKMDPVHRGRTAWITSRDTLNIGPPGDYAVSLHKDYGPKLSQFGHIVLCLEQIQEGLRMGSVSDICDRRDGFDYHKLERIGILIHEVEIVVPTGLAFREQLSVKRWVSRLDVRLRTGLSLGLQSSLRGSCRYEG